MTKKSNKVNKIEQSLKGEGSSSLENKSPKTTDIMGLDALQQVVAAQFSLETPSTAKIKDLRVKGNPNRAYKKKKNSVEGNGRAKGQVNLKYTKDDEGNKIGATNKYGVYFTMEEKKKFESRINNIQRKQKRYQTNEIGVLFGYDMGGELTDTKDFIMLDHSKSLHQFKTKKDFDEYFKRVAYASSRQYEDDQVNEMKRRYILSLENTLLADGDKESQSEMRGKLDEIIETIQNMTPKEFALRYGLDYYETLSFNYKEEITGTQAQLEAVKNSLTCKLPSQTEFDLRKQLKKQEEEKKAKAYQEFLADFDFEDNRASKRKFNKWYNKK